MVSFITTTGLISLSQKLENLCLGLESDLSGYEILGLARSSACKLFFVYCERLRIEGVISWPLIE